MAALITTAIGSMAQTDPLAGKRIGVIGDSYVKTTKTPWNTLGIASWPRITA